jgi:DNA invertase Pin-like site-specific DNA recombinase
VIVVEALDRLSHNLSEIARLHDELQFTRIGLHIVSLGRIETMHVGMLGTMAQIYVNNLRETMQRGSSAESCWAAPRRGRPSATTSSRARSAASV